MLEVIQTHFLKRFVHIICFAFVYFIIKAWPVNYHFLSVEGVICGIINHWLRLATTRLANNTSANFNKWLCEWLLIAKSGCKPQVVVSFCLQAQSFKLYLYNCEADPLRILFLKKNSIKKFSQNLILWHKPLIKFSNVYILSL